MPDHSDILITNQNPLREDTRLKIGMAPEEIEMFSKGFNPEQMQLIEFGRVSVLKDFDAMTKADVLMGFTPEEWAAIKKFFAWNKQVSGWHL